MSLLLMMGGSDTPSIGSLFANNEAGLAIDVGDRYGASESKRTWRRNLLLYSEQFDNAAWSKQNSLSVTPNTDIGVDGLLTADTLLNNGLANAAAYQSTSMEAGTYSFRIWVKAGTATQVQLAAWRSGVGLFATTTVSGLTSSYQEVTLTINNAASGTVLVYIYPNNSSATSGSIVVSRSMVVAGSNFGDYQPITDWNTEFKAAFPTHSLYVDSNGVAPAVYPGDQVGLILDTSRGGLDSLGSELWTNPTPTLADNAGSAAAYNSGTRTMTNGGSTATGYPRFSFNLGLTSGRFYKIDGVITGNPASLSTVRLALSGSANNVTYNSTTGVISGFALAGSASLEFVTNLTSGQSLVISSLSIREIPGNHAYQTTSGSRPALARTPDGGRRNVLTYSEQFDNAAWTRTNTPTVTANTQLSVDGTLTADTLEDTSNSTYAQLSQSFTFLAAAYVFSIDIRKTAGALSSYPAIEAGPAGVYHIINTTAGTSAAVGAGQTCSVTSISTDWWRVSVSFTATAAASKVAIYPAASTDGTSLSATATGSVTVSRAQLETGSSATAYQKVGLTSDVTESGKRDCWGLLFDGSDDSLQTASVDFSATDKMTVMAGVRKNSDAAIGIVAELTTSVTTNSGSFYVAAPEQTTTNGNFSFKSRGTNDPGVFAGSGVKLSPVTAILSAIGSISDDTMTLRFNGALAENKTNDQGTGNYANAAVFIGSRSGSLRLNGLIYTLIIRGATTPTGTIADFEKNLLAKRAGTSW